MTLTSSSQVKVDRRQQFLANVLKTIPIQSKKANEDTVLCESCEKKSRNGFPENFEENQKLEGEGEKTRALTNVFSVESKTTKAVKRKCGKVHVLIAPSEKRSKIDKPPAWKTPAKLIGLKNVYANGSTKNLSFIRASAKASKNGKRWTSQSKINSNFHPVILMRLSLWMVLLSNGFSQLLE